MDKQKDIIHMLELMTAPAFCAKDGKVGHMNAAAQKLMLRSGTPLSDLLKNHCDEYTEFNGGCLFVTLNLDGHEIGATVNRVGENDIFVIDQQSETDLRVMALVAQNLRLPLADVLVLTDRLLPTLEADANPNQKKQIHQINRKLTQLIRTILNMADATRYSGDCGTNLTLLDATSVIDEILERAQVLLEYTGVHLNIHLHQEAILTLIDAEKLERAIYNLLSNAVKAALPEGTVTVRLWCKENRFYLSVEDDGPGLSSEVMGNIFARYQRTAGLEDGRNGLGLGMALVRTAASVHGGTVLVQQPATGGTKVTLSIPVKTSSELSMRSPGLFADYAGDRDHGLLELSEVLPPELYTYND